MPETCKEPCEGLIRLGKDLEKLQESSTITHKEIFKRLNDLEKAEAAQEQHFVTVNEKLDKLIEWQENQRDTLGISGRESHLGCGPRRHRLPAGGVGL